MASLATIAAASPPLAAVLDLNALLAAIIYSVAGVGMFAAAFWVIIRIAPFSIRKEIEEDQNTALGIIIGAVFIGIAVIIGAAISG